MNDSCTTTLNTAALAALGALMASGLWLEPNSAKALVAFGMCAIALVAGWQLRDRMVRVPAWGFFALAMALAIAPLAAGELHGASRWLFPGEALQLRGGLWAALFYAAGLARIDGSGSVMVQRATLAAAFISLLVIIVAFGALPDLFSAFMLFVGALIVVWQRPHLARKVVTWPIGVCVVALVGLILKSPYRLERVVSGFRRAWLAPETDATGRGWAATQTKVALERAEWFGGGVRSELPARIDWYGITELATQLGLAAAIAAALTLAFFSAVLVKRAISRRGGPAGGFWLAGATLFAVNTLVAAGPAFGFFPYMGHWSVPFVAAAADINWMGIFLAGALLLPAARTGASSPATQTTASAGA